MGYRIIRKLWAYAPLVQLRSEGERKDEMGLEIRQATKAATLP